MWNLMHKQYTTEVELYLQNTIDGYQGNVGSGIETAGKED